MNDREQIEELAKELDYCETHDCVGESCAKCRAIWLIENGYRKIPEGSVVLSKEEWQEILDDTVKNTEEKAELINEIEKARKQAIKDFIQAINKEYEDEIFSSCLREDINRIAKAFGVEL